MGQGQKGQRSQADKVLTVWVQQLVPEASTTPLKNFRQLGNFSCTELGRAGTPQGIQGCEKQVEEI